MKFRYKVLMINMILLSLSLGMIGYFMIHKNYRLALDTQIKNAVIENNLAQSSVEYELLDILNSRTSLIQNKLSDIGSKVGTSMISSDSSLYIMFGENYVYTSDDNTEQIPDSLFTDLSIGSKNYILCEESGNHYIYVTSISNVKNLNLYIISKRDISDVYFLLNQEIQYFRVLLVATLFFCSILMYFISSLLTRPMEQLNHVSDEFAKGNYAIRSNVHTTDEIGLLSEKYNNMAEAVELHIEELNDMIKRRDQFVADFTHEIKTPMTSIIGYADTMRSIELSREDQIMSMDYIFTEGKRLEAMSMKLFDLIYLKGNNIEKAELHTETLAREIEKSVTPSLAQKNISFELSIENGIISGDKDLLKSVFINLIDNARKASDEGSSISFLGKCLTDAYIFTVKDSGCGMKAEDINRICDEFYMVDKSRSRKEGGAGLGMSLVAIILDRHNAVLDIKSAPGQGTSMIITFPKGESYEKIQK